MERKKISSAIFAYWSKLVATVCFVIITVLSAGGQTTKKDSTKYVTLKHGDKGFELRAADDKYLMEIAARLQFRFATPGDQNPVTFDDFISEKKRIFKINRARLKIGGHAYKPWLKYYFEYELAQSNLLDFRVMIEKWTFLNFKVGQWKLEYSQERCISSGEQQMVDRSIINRPFTADRQQGIEVYGRLKKGTVADFNYWAALLTGMGRGETSNDDDNLMIFGRVQWNPLGRPVEFEGSDLEIHEKPALSIAYAAFTNRSPYTRFSQAGGGDLEGFAAGLPGQYRVNQYNIESAFKFKGFSWQSEWHHKEIIDKFDNDATSNLTGMYVQGGYLFHQLFHWWPRQMELAGRFALYRPDTSIKENNEKESGGAVNWFFNGHKNKLTAELTYFDFTRISASEHGWRFRLQWDISF
ncbi:porin [Pollutibacter soli]|uniref:porin n=1 Tax=Pollutibacter soli TaxID=3034157 RepID=UPI003013BB95